MIDNPISWGILVVLVIFAVIWFARKCEEELAQNRRENDDFFWEYEYKLSQKRKEK